MEKLKVFVSYSHENPDWLATVGKMLKALQTSNVIDSFDDRLIAIGQEWDATIKAKLEEADLVILIVTFDFLGSTYINQVEIEHALQRHHEDRTRLLPIIAEECPWKSQKWAKIDAWPTKDSSVLPLDKWEDKNAALTQIFEGVTALAKTWRPVRSDPDAAPAADPTTPPYRGLFAFEPEDTDDFFGRADLTDKLWAAVSTNRLTLLTGGSGSGKSSIVNAGIIPRLDPERWCIARMRPGETPIDNLARQLALRMMPGANTFDATDRAKEIAKKLDEEPSLVLDYAATHKDQHQKSLFLVIDQFEETFNLAKPKENNQHDRLIDLLLAIAGASDNSPVTALLAMRVDFQPELQDDRPELVAALQHATIMMRRMTEAELAAAIAGPAKRRGVAVEEGLLGKLVSEVGRNPDALPLLEVTLETLWNGRGDGPLILDAYEKLDGLAGALAVRAEAALAKEHIDEERFRRLFLQLVKVDPQGGIDNVTRQPRTRSHLDGLDKGLWPMGQELASPEHRLLVIGRNEAASEDTLDVTHEALFRRWQRLAKWIDAERDFLLFCQRLDQRWEDFASANGDPGLYLPRVELAQAQRYVADGAYVLRENQIDFITASATHWTEDAADDAAQKLWSRLELRFNARYDGIPQHQRTALADLTLADRETRQRFLLIATSDSDAARKFNREPELILRAVTGLDPLTALDFAMPAINAKSGSSIQTKLTWLSVARHFSPIAPTHPPGILDRVLDAIDKTTHPRQLLVVAHTINAFAEKFDTQRLSEVANQTVERAFDLIEDTPIAFVHIINALADKLDTQSLSEVANRAIERAFDAAHNSTDSLLSESLARTIADKLDTQTASRAVERASNAIDEIDNTTNWKAIQGLAKIINAFADKVDTQTAGRAVERAFDAIDKTTSSAVLEAHASTIIALADKLDTEAATRIIERANQGFDNFTTPYKLQTLARIINALADKLDTQRLSEIENRIVELALQGFDYRANPLLADSFAPTIIALAGKLDTEAATRIVERAIEKNNKTTNPLLSESVAKIINAFADKLDTQTAGRVVERAFDAIDKPTSSVVLEAHASTIIALADKLDTEAATRIIERAFEAIEKTSWGKPDPLALAQNINALADKLDTQTIGRTFERAILTFDRTTFFTARRALAQTVNALAEKLDTQPAIRAVERAIQGFYKTTDSVPFPTLAQIINAVAPRLPPAALVLAANETLKQPLGGHQPVTEALMEAITRALGRHDLLDPFPERSFWAVMQHLTEVKAANPGWDWLDLARPPMPIDELIATFRDLCDNPPAWPTTSTSSR